jgi:hypothetical protein
MDGQTHSDREAGSSCREDRLNLLIILAFLSITYGPYVVRGGLIRDDLGFATTSRHFSDYWHFQAHISSLMTMTARPVSALLHGASYWLFDANAAAHHTINILLFSATLCVVYLALSRTLQPQIALTTTVLAAAYPAGSGTVFSSMMMNSNLAGLLWAIAMYVSSSSARPVTRVVLTTGCLILSGLAYESFVPLFVATFLVARGGQPRRGSLAAALTPVLVAIPILVWYRLIGEGLIFGSTFERSAIPVNPITRLIETMATGLRVTTADSARLTMKALRNLTIIPVPVLVGAVTAAGVISCAVARAVTEVHRSKAMLLAVGVALFIAAHLIFVFSSYSPTAAGFESRTQGGVRFAAAFLMASVLVTAGGWLANRVGVTLLVLLLALGMQGQREGWIYAAEYDDEIVRQLSHGLRGFPPRDSLTVIAELDARIPHLINREPVFGTPWDLGPSLELANPGYRIGANVYRPGNAVADTTGVTISGYWKATYPFLQFRSGIGTRVIRSREEWDVPAHPK